MKLEARGVHHPAERRARAGDGHGCAGDRLEPVAQVEAEFESGPSHLAF